MLVSIKRLRRDTNEEVNPKWPKLQQSKQATSACSFSPPFERPSMKRRRNGWIPSPSRELLAQKGKNRRGWPVWFRVLGPSERESPSGG